jgi:uncharacterized delta-60 repeat protein
MLLCIALLAVLVVPFAAQAASGDLDASFSGDGRQVTDFGGDDSASDVALQEDGRIVVVGITDGATNRDFLVARYNTDGSLDTSFSDDGRQTTDFGDVDGATAVAIQSDGAIVVVGYTGDTFALARYNPDGSLDKSFSDDGKQTTAFEEPTVFQIGSRGEAVAIQQDGKIVAGGVSGNGFAVARYNLDGSLDSTFSGDGKQTTDFGGNDNQEGARGVALQSDGKIIALGGSGGLGSPQEHDQFSVARYNPDGSLDSTFSGDGKQTTDFSDFDFGYGQAVAVQPNGKIVGFGSVGSPGSFAFVRYNADGSLDGSFSGDGKQTADFGGHEISGDLVLQPDGKIVAVGEDDPGDFALARLNSDGSLDNSFSDDGKQTTDFGAIDGASGVALQSDGKIVAAGYTTDLTDGDVALARYGAPGDPPPPPPPPPPPSSDPCGVEGAAGYLYPAKLRVSRARVLRSDRRLDVYAPITSRADGPVKVTYQGDRRTKTFAAEVTAGDAALDRIRFKEPITAGQARLGTGIVTLNYQGDQDTRPEEVRLRAASQDAELAVEEISLLDGRLSARGSVTSRAKGIVRFSYSYLDAAGQPQIYPARATIQDDGDWKLEDDPVPPQLARCGGYLSILFTGYFERRIRGEMLAYQLDAGQTRRP